MTSTGCELTYIECEMTSTGQILRFSRRLATLMGSVCVDCEIIPDRNLPSAPSDITATSLARPSSAPPTSPTDPSQRQCEDSGAIALDAEFLAAMPPDIREEIIQQNMRLSAVEARGRPEMAAEAVSPGPIVTAVSTSGADAGEEIGVTGERKGEEDDFEIIRPIRVATLQQFYSLIKPCMEQAAADMAYTRRVADHDEGTSDGDPLFVYPRHKKGGGVTTTTDLSAADCCICMDSRVQVVTVCGHAFCEECQTRWRENSSHCPLCRAELEEGGDASFVLAEAELHNDSGEQDQMAEVEALLEREDAFQRVFAFISNLPIAAESRGYR